MTTKEHNESATKGLLDTSVFIARESGGPLDVSGLPEESYVSVITRAELQAGVLAARDAPTRARRLSALDLVAGLTLLPVDAHAATHWAALRAELAAVGRKVNVNDLWIAAIALAHGLPIVTQDSGFDPLVDLGGPAVFRV